MYSICDSLPTEHYILGNHDAEFLLENISCNIEVDALHARDALILNLDNYRQTHVAQPAV
jgi:hypothetical protein